MVKEKFDISLVREVRLLGAFERTRGCDPAEKDHFGRIERVTGRFAARRC